MGEAHLREKNFDCLKFNSLQLNHKKPKIEYKRIGFKTIFWL